MSTRMQFGAFLAPHHPIGEHPTLQLRRDLELAEQLDALGYEEFWVGEHHSGGWETIGHPELFLAAAGERTTRIRLGTGVVSLPYHHPYNVAGRIVQLDHLTRGRAMLGVGPGALPSDARTHGIPPALLRDRMDEGLGVILRLLREDAPVTHKSDWFQLHEATLQIKPVQAELPVASYSEEGLQALPTQWGFAETYARENAARVDRANWRVVMPWHIAESKEQALREVAEGVAHWHNQYNVEILGRPGAEPVGDAAGFARAMDRRGGAIFGTPDDAVAAIAQLQEISGGFGTLLAFAHDWASHEATRRSYDLFARYVIPRVNGMLAPLQRSADAVSANKAELMEGGSQAILAAIRKHNASHPRAR
ncbi:MAG: LLM class flavin-dependent oxidoreductase [Myxococcota bacterium]